MRIIYKQIHLISCLNIHDKEKILVKMQILTGILQFHFATHISLQDSLNIFRKAVFHSIGMFHSIFHSIGMFHWCSATIVNSLNGIVAII